MDNLLKAMEQTLLQDQTFTQNMGITYKTTQFHNVDLFFQINAMRNQDEEKIINSFSKCFSQEALDAMKILFWSRDIREGQGERRTFRILLKYLASTTEGLQALKHNIHNIPYYGRWDDLFVLFDTPAENQVLDLIKQELDNGNTLCAKWMPREKSKHKLIAKKIRKKLGLSPKNYRKLLSEYTSVVENSMCKNDWDSIEYSKVPSLAMNNYRKAFKRHSQANWETYISNLEKGVEKVNASTLYPHDIVKPILGYCEWDADQPDWRLPEQQWLSLPNYLQDNQERIMPLIDVSGSMYSDRNPSPIEVAISLGIYIAEKNKGPFKDCFITFSSSPQLAKLKGATLFERVQNLKKADWGMNTDLSKVFNLILDSAIRYNLPTDSLPSVILILSDMEFDSACNPSLSAFQSAKTDFENAGFKLPKIVFWNLDAKSENFPVQYHENGTALISGFSPSILKTLLSGSQMTPHSVMRDTIDANRYNQVTLTGI